MILSPGDRFDRYLVEALLGRGGMGEVWRAVDPKLDRRIALKILARSDSLEPRWSEARVRMLREARAAAALDHPNVVAVFDVGEVGETPYIAMELVLGVTLREYVGDARVSPARRVKWMIEIARALGAAHARGIVHRDVKPENVMVRGDGGLKVLDFGIARRARVEAGPEGHVSSVVSRDSEPIGTLRYMAPEQLEGGAIDGRADQFAWGVVALELLRGEHPWGAKGAAVAIVDAIVRGEAPPLAEIEEIPPAFRAAVARAVAKRPGDRFPSMDTLLGTLSVDDRLPAVRPRAERPLAFASTSRPVTIGELATPRLPFDAGAVLAGRFEIVRVLGRGGMGEVYEALDRRDGGRVALKTVRADRANEPRLLERFRREVELARRVVHANVVRVIDVCTHKLDSDPEPTLILAMELLDGESLSDFLRRRGPLKAVEARPLVEQMASALGAAHVAGVVHRDFKSSNVILVPEEGGKVRAVVTDFGLSRAITPSEASDQGSDNTTLSRDVVLLGSPAYMAPEQIAGTAVDARADVYALGIVLFEMVTGRLPFSGDTPLETAMMRLTQRPPPPRSFAPSLEPSWDTAIVRCLAREPGDRFASTTELVAALDARAPSKRRARALGAIAVALGAVAVAGAAALHRGSPGVPAPSTSAAPLVAAAPPTPAAPTTRPAVAVWTLYNASGDPHVAWLGSALGEMLRTELSAGEALRVVPGASVARAQRDLSIADGSDLGRLDATRAAAAVGATVVVDGAYVTVGADGGRRLRVDLHAKDGASGDTLASVAESGGEDELFDLVERAAGALRKAIHAPAAEAASERMARVSLPAGGAASREYAEGPLALQSLDYATARDHFERAIAVDPSAPMPHASLSEALFAVGYVARAAEEAKAALDRAADVSREDRLVIEAHYRECSYDWSGAVDRWHVLAGFFPDNVEYGLALAKAYAKAGEPLRARDAIELLRKLPPPVPSDPRLDLVAGSAAIASDFNASAVLAKAALEKAKASGSRSLATEADMLAVSASANLGQSMATHPDDFRRIERAYLELGNRGAAVVAATYVGSAYGRLGQHDAMTRETARALAAAKALGYPELEARAEYRYAQALRHTKPEEAIPHLSRALEIARAVGNRNTEQAVLNQQGLLAQTNGKLTDARALFAEAAKIAGAIGQKSEETDALDNLALVLANLGEAREALSVHERMAQRYAETGNRNEQFLTLVNEAVVLLDMGEPGRAMARMDDADRAAGGAQDTEYKLDADGTRARIVAMQGDTDAARRTLGSVMAALRQSGGNDAAEGWEETLSQIDVADGVSRTAELRHLVATRTEGSGATNLATLAASLWLDGKKTEAIADARRAVALAKGEQVYGEHQHAVLTAAGVLARAGEDAEALAIARPVAADAEPRGLVPLVLEARLVAAQTGEARRAVDANRAELASIAQAAKEHGLAAIARRAEKSAASP